MKSKPDRDDKYFSGGFYIVDLFQDKTTSESTIYYSDSTPRDLLIKDKFEFLLKDGFIIKTATLHVDKVKKKRDIDMYNQISK